jgi:hypothetical protein
MVADILLQEILLGQNGFWCVLLFFTEQLEHAVDSIADIFQQECLLFFYSSSSLE